MDQLVFYKWSLSHGIPSDIVQHIVRGFYEPLMARFIGEKVCIARMLAHLQSDARGPELRPPFGSRWSSVLHRRLRHLNKHALVDPHLGVYIKMIMLMVAEGAIDANDVLHVLEKGLEREDPYAFKVLYDANLHGHFPSRVESCVQSAGERFSRLATWKVSDIEPMSPIVKYHLDKKTEEPVLEWLVVWQRKGYNICRSVLNLTEAQRDQMNLLILRKESPEIKNRRLNSIVHNIYSDCEFKPVSL